MTDLSSAASTALAPSSPRRTSKPEQVAKSLKHIRENLLAPFKAWADMREQVPAQDDRGNRIMAMLPACPHVEQPATEEDRLRMRDRADDVLAYQPALTEVEAVSARAIECAIADFDLRQTRFIVALMIDAFPNARPHCPATYLETVVDQLTALQASPSAIAKGCDDIKRSATFLPAAGEVIEKVEAATKSLDLMTTLARRFITQARYIGSLIEWLDEVPLYSGVIEDRHYPPSSPVLAEYSASWSVDGRTGRVSWV